MNISNICSYYMKTKIKNKNKKDRQLKKKYWVPTKKFQLMKPT